MALKKRLKKKIHKRFIEDIVYEISITNQWRNAIFNLSQNQHLLINKDSVLPLPPYIEPFIRKYNLQYAVSVVEKCPENFDDDLVIFKFSPKIFPDVKRYSGNNPDVRL